MDDRTGSWINQGRAFAAGCLALTSLAAAGCHTSPPAGGSDGGASCSQSSDCNGNGVCRNGACTNAPCSLAIPCQAGEACVNNMCQLGNGPKACQSDSDCPSGTGVCRMMTCTLVACAEATPCPNGELCLNGKCAPGTAMKAGVPGHNISSGGSIAMSSKHIHIGLTGQGRAVGKGSSANHSHTTGATSVMQR